MKNLSLSMKMSVIFAVLIVVSLVIAAVGVNRLYYINTNVDKVAGLSEKLALTSKIYEKAIWCVRVEKNIIFAPTMEKKGDWEAKFNSYAGEMKALEKELDALLSEEAKKILREYDEKWAVYEANARQIIALSKTYGGIQWADGSATLEQRKNFIRAADLSQVTGRKVIDEMEGSLNGLIDRYKSQIAEAEADSEKALDQTIWLLIIVSVVGLLSGIALAFIILRSVTKSIGEVMEGLTEGSGQVHSASGQLSETSQQMAEGASEQAASIEETSSSLEEISSMTKHNADNSNAV
ncbi:MAG: methyl-accepting chemotaxis protein, partial [Nitrospinae bacterium]|nr:methyl-accepting chemotaxis protein [Nitrospinota bacterium]